MPKGDRFLTNAHAERGIRRTAFGWQVYLHHHDRFLSKHFPADTPLETLRDWRKDQQARIRLKLPLAPEVDSFAADCQAYLSAVQGMTTFSDRKYRIEQWREALGPDRVRAEIRPAEMRQVLETWKAEGLSAGSLNLRRTALMHLYTVLDGKAAPNPVRDVPRYRELLRPLQLPTVAEAEKAIAAVRADKTRAKTRARLRVLLWTGLPPAQMMRLTKADVDLPHARVFVHGRQKGRGSRARWLPLLPKAVEAFKEFARVKAWGVCSTSSMHSSLHAGCDRAGVPRFRVYDLRHLFLTLIASIAKDDRVVAELAMHSDLRQTRRYTEQSVDPRVAAALTRVAEVLK